MHQLLILRSVGKLSQNLLLDHSSCKTNSITQKAVNNFLEPSLAPKEDKGLDSDSTQPDMESPLSSKCA